MVCVLQISLDLVLHGVLQLGKWRIFMTANYQVFQTIEQMHDYLDRSGEVFEFGNTASPDSHGWRDQPVPLPVLRVVMDWPFALADWSYVTGRKESLDAEFVAALELRSMSTWTDEELRRYSLITGQVTE